jgi:HSP20 family protein
MWTNRLFGHMDRVFGPTGFDAPPPLPNATAYPPLNVWEDDDNFYVEAELPGLKPDAIDVSVTEGDQLTIAGARAPAAPAGGAWLRQECGYGRFSRTVTLPAEVDADAVAAAYDAGVLTLTLPKLEQAKPKRIAVKAAALPALPAGK